MESGLISVVVPIFDGAEFVKEAVDSILGQTYTNFEVIFVIENGADPDITSLLYSYAEPRFRLFFNKIRLGLPASLNEGVKQATGEFVARMDSDDICRPDRFRRQVEAFRSDPNLGLCGTFCQVFGDETWEFRPACASEQIRIEMLSACPFVHPSVMLRREAFLRADLFYDETLGATEDFDLWSRAGLVLKLGNVPEILLDYRKRRSAATNRHASLGAQIYRDVIHRQLRRLTPVAPHELDVHLRFFSLGITSLGDVAVTIRWFERLVESNERQGLYDRKQFSELFAWRLYDRVRGIGSIAPAAMFASSRLAPIIGEGERNFLRELTSA